MQMKLNKPEIKEKQKMAISTFPVETAFLPPDRKKSSAFLFP